MNAVTALGFLAAFLTTAAYVPQVIKTWRSGSSADLSPGTFSMLTAGILAWLVYGVLIGDPPIIVANVVTLGLVGSVLVHVVRGRRARPGRGAP